MMSKWRSLFATGCLLAALVVFGPSAAFAQATAPTAAQLTVIGTDYDTLRVRFEIPTASEANTAKYTLRHQALSSGTAIDSTKSVMGPMDILKTAGKDEMIDVGGTPTAHHVYQLDLEDLMPSTRYLVEVTAVGGDNGSGGLHANASVTNPGTTDAADKPDDVRELVLMAGDGLILAEWEETTDNGSPVTGYQVQYKESDEADSKYKTSRDGDYDDMNTSTIHEIANLENDKEYTVRVRAYSYTAAGDWSKEEDAMPMAGAMRPMPTPALPVFGAFALGAGLLAAGRARLRRREQRQLTR